MLWQTLMPWTFHIFLLINKSKSSTKFFLFHKIWADSTLLDSAQQFSKAAVQTYTPATVCNQLFHIWSIVQHLVLSDLKIFDSLRRQKCYLIVALICIYLITNKTGHVFILHWPFHSMLLCRAYSYILNTFILECLYFYYWFVGVFLDTMNTKLLFQVLQIFPLRLLLVSLFIKILNVKKFYILL